MLVDFRNDLMKNFQEDFINNSKNVKQAKKSTILSKPFYRSFIKKPLIHIPKPSKANILFNFWDDYSPLPNETNKKIIISTPFESPSKKAHFSTYIKEFLLKRVKRCEEKESNKEKKGTIALNLKETDMDVGMDSIFKVLTKHIKVFFYKLKASFIISSL